MKQGKNIQTFREHPAENRAGSRLFASANRAV
jgi:hypothetical protein